VTLSMGVATLVPDRNLAPKDLTEAADTQLYAAKRSGRNRIQAQAAPQAPLPPKFTAQGS